MSIFLEEVLDFREVIHLRKNQATSPKNRKEEVSLLYVSNPVALSQEDASFSHSRQVQTQQSSLHQHTHQKTPTVTWAGGLC